MAATAVPHHERMQAWCDHDPLIAALDADASLRCIRDSTVAAHSAPGTVHGATGKMLAWNYKREGEDEVVSAIRFLYGAQGPPETAHGGQIANAFDHVFGHCMRSAVGVGTQFTVNVRTEFKAPCPLQQTLRCVTRVASREPRPGKDGKDGRVKVQLETELTTAEGATVALGECLFIAIADSAGELTRHSSFFDPELLKRNEEAEAAARQHPIVYDDVGRMLAPEMPYFSCRGGAARCFAASRDWVEGDALVQQLLALQGAAEMDVAWMQSSSRWAGNGGRWLPTALAEDAAVPGSSAAELVATLRSHALADAPAIEPSVSVTDCRIMEAYCADDNAARVVGALQFGNASAGPPGRAHGGVVNSAMDESFVWLGTGQPHSDRLAQACADSVSLVLQVRTLLAGQQPGST